MNRTILHVDMDAFYVSVEMRRHPELIGRPVVVGGAGNRGVVAAANYEARRFGVFSAMPSSRARRLCPQAVFLSGDHAHYAEVSRQVHEIFGAHTPLVEPIALDEAFLDVTGAVHLFGDGVSIGHRIREAIRRELDLPCSVGVAANKFIAKLASKAAKPRVANGQVTAGPGVLSVEPGRELEFLHPLPVSALWGVGPATLRKLERLSVHTVGDLAGLPDDVVLRSIGQAHGTHLLELARGYDERPVVPEREAKSIGQEETFSHDLHSPDEIRTEMVRLADVVASRLRSHSWAARTVMLKVRFSSFETITRSVTPESPMTTGPAMVAALVPALDSFDPSIGVRLVGVSVANFVEPVEQMSLFDSPTSNTSTDVSSLDRRWAPASRAIDEIRERFGQDAISPAGAARRRRSTPWGPDAEVQKKDPGNGPAAESV
ncbi:MAG: polymerase [Actinomycetota bacterium]|jgi:DNA polymerase-4